eukprot:TRINITY_DN11865_c0_g1_i1.p1 TRINITY_DN11865_c0_g1~~TRINITY_DN11865_c0_g1_i1.p1  ORF type:complete len:460 (-),score=52.14 TRINITY_DN11865_c0_g1_i1:23-1378(-)
MACRHGIGLQGTLAAVRHSSCVEQFYAITRHRAVLRVQRAWRQRRMTHLQERLFCNQRSEPALSSARLAEPCASMPPLQTEVARPGRSTSPKSRLGVVRQVCPKCGEEKDLSEFGTKQLKKAKKRSRALENSASGSEAEDGTTAAVAPTCKACIGERRAVDNGLPVGVPMDPVSGELMLSKQVDASPSHLYAIDTSSFPIEGLRYYPEWLTREEEEAILRIVDAHDWKNVFRRRQQFYGEVYYHTKQDVAEVQPLLNSDGALVDNEAEVGVHPLRPLFQFLIDKFYTGNHAIDRAPIFGADDSEFPTQILINEYLDDIGIASHFEDEAAFGEVICSLSLLQPVYMNLEKPRLHNNQCQDLEARTRLLLEPRSLLIMSGEARHQWRHGITQHRVVRLPDGSEVRRAPKSPPDGSPQYRRVSLTIRHLLAGRKQAAAAASEPSDENGGASAAR